MTIPFESRLPEALFFKPSSLVKFKIEASVQHWQLRDLIKCSADMYPHEVVLVKRKSVLLLNTKTFSQRTLFGQTPFPPLCFDVGCGYVAVGGHKSVISITNRIDIVINTEFTNLETTNNAMLISQYQNVPALFASNNDETVKICKLPDLSNPEIVDVGFPVNSVAVSKDSEKMIAAGDSDEIKIYSLSSSGPNLMQTVRMHNSSSGFGCSWNRSSDMFVVASEDGFANIYDIRSWKPLATIHSISTAPESKAMRKAMFSTTVESDLLLLTEHQRYVHVVDARTFASQQVIDITKNGDAREITGASFSSDNRYLYIGTGDGIHRYEMDTRIRRCFPMFELN